MHERYYFYFMGEDRMKYTTCIGMYICIAMRKLETVLSKCIVANLKSLSLISKALNFSLTT
jgi:hypothetical protein